MRITKSKVIGLALNIKEDCNCCAYCWNGIINDKFHEDKCGSTKVDTHFDELIEQIDNGRIPKPIQEEKCQFYINSGRDLLLGAKSEFFHPDAKDTAMKVLGLFDIYPEVSNRARILTKQNLTTDGVLNRLPKDIWVGASITTLSTKISKIVQPRAAKPDELIGMLVIANDLGFPTWVVVEPFFQYMDVWELIDQLQFVKEMWVGRLNGGRNNPVAQPIDAILPIDNVVGDFAASDEEIMKQFKHAQHKLKGAVVQKDTILPDGRVSYNQNTPFVYNLYPKKEVKRLLEKAEKDD